MPVETLNCPMCGAPATSDATLCDHCGARLGTVACPSCFGVMFIGQQFCPHCGAKADRQPAAATSPPAPCPRCKTNMEAIVLAGSNMQECPKCEGLWTDAETLRQICANREQQSAVLGMATHLPTGDGVELEKVIRYLPCPVCGNLMNRVNFANYSNVIVDVCRQHGTWFDHDELRRIVEYIRNGGLEKGRARDIANLEEERRTAADKQTVGGDDFSLNIGGHVRDAAVSEIAQSVMDLFFRR